MDRFQIQEAFHVLKPYCDALMGQPDINNARNVADTVSQLSEKVVQDLFGYIYEPLTGHLCNPTLSKNVKEELVKTLHSIVSKVKINQIKQFTKLYSCSLIQIFDKSQPFMLISGHEEMKSAVLRCIKTLIHSSFTDVIESLYTKENLRIVGHGLLLSMRIAIIEKSRTLRLDALETIMALCQVDDASDQTDIILQDQVADVITFFFPGLVSGLHEITMGNEIQGCKVTMLSLRAWGKIVSLVMKDKYEDVEEPSLETLNPKEKTESLDIDAVFKSGVRSADWYEASVLKLKPFVKQLDTIKNHPHHKVRKELAETIALLLRTCSRNMKSNIVFLIGYLISLSEDDVPEVKTVAAAALEIINSNYTNSTDMSSLVELLEENLYNLITRLPTIIRRSGTSWNCCLRVVEDTLIAQTSLGTLQEVFRSSLGALKEFLKRFVLSGYFNYGSFQCIVNILDEHEQLATLNQLAGYLKLLGPKRLPLIMASKPHVLRIIQSLVYALELDTNDISLFQTVNVKNLDEPAYSYGSRLWRRLRFIRNKSCEEKLEAICRYLGQVGDLRALVDIMFELINDYGQYRKEFILLLNWITDVPITDEAMLPLYKDIIQFYTEDELWYPTIDVTEDIPLRVAQGNLLQCCVLVEGLGLIALNIKTSIYNFLLKTLYLLIERAGSAHSLISFVGSQALNNVAKSQGFSTVGDLLRANVDYLSYHVTMKLQRIERNPGVLDVVGVVMKYGTLDVLPCINEIVEATISQLNKSFQEKNSYGYLKVFHTFLICVKYMAPPKKPEDIEENYKVETNQSELVILALLEYYNAKKVDEMIDDEPEEVDDEKIKSFSQIAEECTNDGVALSEDEDLKKPKVPLVIKMVEDVMNHCLHFLPSNTQNSLLAMLTLEEGLHILREWEDQLLPVVHLIWHPLVERFKDENPLIINRAWQLLNVLAQVSKDFIRARTLKEVFPALAKFLRESAKQSYKKTSHDAYKFTQLYKVQVELLSSLGKFAIYLKFREREVWDILTNTEQYLSRHQHPVLQSACLKLYTEISYYNGDLILVKCLSIWDSKIAKIPVDASLRMEDLKITETARANEYFQNVQTILKIIEDRRIAVKT